MTTLNVDVDAAIRRHQEDHGHQALVSLGESLHLVLGAVERVITAAGGALAVDASSGRAVAAIDGDPSALLKHAPERMGELAMWFATLAPEQLRRVWVAAVVECAALEHGHVNVGDLAAALSVVREMSKAAEQQSSKGGGSGGEGAAVVVVAPSLKKRRMFEKAKPATDKKVEQLREALRSTGLPVRLRDIGRTNATRLRTALMRDYAQEFEVYSVLSQRTDGLFRHTWYARWAPGAAARTGVAPGSAP